MQTLDHREMSVEGGKLQVVFHCGRRDPDVVIWDVVTNTYQLRFYFAEHMSAFAVYIQNGI